MLNKLMLDMDRMAGLCKEVMEAILSLYKMSGRRRRAQDTRDTMWEQKEKAALYKAIMTIYNREAWGNLNSLDIWVAQELVRDYRDAIGYEKESSMWKEAIDELNELKGEAPKPEVAEGEKAFLVYYGLPTTPGFPDTPMGFFKSKADNRHAAGNEVLALIPRNMVVKKITAITETDTL